MTHTLDVIKSLVILKIELGEEDVERLLAYTIDRLNDYGIKSYPKIVDDSRKIVSRAFLQAEVRDKKSQRNYYL